MRFLLLCAISGAAAFAVNPAQSPAVSKMLDLFQRLQVAQQAPPSAPAQARHVSFTLSEAEINEYLVYSLHNIPRPGLESVSVKIFPYNYLSSYTVIDFDAVEKWKPGTVPVLLRPVLHGKKAIWVDARFQAKNGKTTFSIEKAYFEKIRLPAFFVEKMMQIVAARQPEKYDTTKPVPLPFGLKQVSTKEKVITGEN